MNHRFENLNLKNAQMNDQPFNVLLIVSSPECAAHSAEYVRQSFLSQKMNLNIYYITDLGNLPEVYNPLVLCEWLRENYRQGRSAIEMMREQFQQHQLKVCSAESAVGNPSILLPGKLEELQPDLIIVGPGEGINKMTGVLAKSAKCPLLIVPDEKVEQEISHSTRQGMRMSFMVNGR